MSDIYQPDNDQNSSARCRFQCVEYIDMIHIQLIFIKEYSICGFSINHSSIMGRHINQTRKEDIIRVHTYLERQRSQGKKNLNLDYLQKHKQNCWI